MISTSYLKYLWKSKKYLILFSLAMTILFSVISPGSRDGKKIELVLVDALAVALCYALPCLVFRFTHEKRSVDSYYPLPLSRKQLLYTGILFCFLCVFACLTVGNLLIYFLNIRSFIVSPLANILIMSFMMGMLIIVNSCGILLANNTFDAVVILGAYTVLPAVVYVAVDFFMAHCICGFTHDKITDLGLLSPLFLCTEVQRYLVSGEFSMYGIPNWAVITAVLFYTALFSYLLYRFFLNRKTERAGTISDHPLSYPFVIHIYVFLCVFIACVQGVNYSGWKVFNEGKLILYILIFVLYVIANFVYKRKIFLSVKMVVLFTAFFLFGVGSVYMAKETRGFGISDMYVKNDPNVAYEYTSYSYFDGESPDEAINWFYREVVSNGELFSYNAEADEIRTLEAGSIDMSYTVMAKPYADKTLSPQTISLFERIREKAIENYYNGYVEDGYLGGGNLFVYNGYRRTPSSFTYSRDYFYHAAPSLTREELLSLSETEGIQVTFNVQGYCPEDESWYNVSYLLEDGEFIRADALDMNAVPLA